MGYWIVARTHQGKEKYASLNASRQGFGVFIPMIEDGDKQKPMFPAYIFVRTMGEWHTLNSTKGVVSVVMFGEQPSRCPDKVVDQLLKYEKRGVITLPKPELIVGQKLRVISGHLEGQAGLYQGQGPQHRLRVLFDVLSGKQEFLIDPARLIVA